MNNNPLINGMRGSRFTDEKIARATKALIKTLTFSPVGIHFQTAHLDSHLEWSFYSRALVDAHSFIYCTGAARTFTVIPRRVFPDTEQQGAFERLLAEHVPKIVRKA